MNPRKARTRLLIQLGGLVKKSGFSDALDLRGDLQKDASQAEAVATLMGGLLYLRSIMDSAKAEEARARFLELGKDFLRDNPEEAWANGNEQDNDIRSEEHVRAQES